MVDVWIDRKEPPRRRLQRLGFLAGLIAVISLLHYETSTDWLVLHEVYQRVYYLPILLAAFWYGPWIGLMTSTAVCLIYSYHIQMDWSLFPAYSVNQYAEIVLYHALALTTGFLSRREHRQRSRAEEKSSDLAHAYEKLSQASDRLRRAERLAALGELTAGIAHEIRNPLASVKGAVEILEGRIAKDSPDRDFINIIGEEIRRLNQTLTEFLHFARPRPPLFQRGAIDSLIASCVALLREQARQARVDVQTDLDARLPLVDFDPDHIKQVLLNVMLNGIQAMPQGGVLRIRSFLRPAPAGSVRDKAANRSEEKGPLVVEVIDEGQGIDAKILVRAFDPFFTTKTSGMGLGLSVSHRLVESHGGQISLRPNAFRGATCRIELPLKAS